MRRVSLDESELGIDRRDLWAAFEPFALPDTAENRHAWHNIARKQRKRIFKNFRRKLLGGPTKVAERTDELIKDSYGPKWDKVGYANYDPAKSHDNYAPWLWGDYQFMASTYGSARFRHLLIAALIERLQPRSVLEVGCGNGINLLLLANRFPNVTFAGVDLTESGPRLFRELKAAGALPANLAAYAPLPARDPRGFLDADVRQGSAEHLGFPDDSFDLVMSVLALEQMERIRHKALHEMARVSARWTLMIEPFRDVNRYLWPRLNIIRQDYFQGRIRDLLKVGLEPLVATEDFPQEIHLRACMVLAQKTGAEAESERTGLAAQ